MADATTVLEGETVPVSAEIQALLDTPTTPWDDISETGLDMLSDIHLSTTTDQPIVHASRHH